jgi:uncharacterized protein YjbI with pentapeptide repeats
MQLADAAATLPVERAPSMANPAHIEAVISGRSELLLRHRRGGRPDLVDADFHGADLQERDLSYADLTRANLANAKLNYSRLVGAVLKRADCSGAQLRWASLQAAHSRPRGS